MTIQCDKFMRDIDDLIDNHKAKNKLIALNDRNEFLTDVEKWLKMIIVSKECNPQQAEKQEIMSEGRYKTCAYPTKGSS